MGKIIRLTSAFSLPKALVYEICSCCLHVDGKLISLLSLEWLSCTNTAGNHY